MDFIYIYETELKKPLAIPFSGVERGLRRRDDGGNVNNVQCKTNHFESPPYNEYILIKIYNKIK
jgi:hypothetical protein